MSILGEIKHWLRGERNSAAQAERIDRAISAGHALEDEARKLNTELDRISKCHDPWAEFVHAMRTARFKAELEEKRQRSKL